MADIKVVVHGALGKMGQEVLNTVFETEGMVPFGAADIAAAEGLTSLPDGSGEIPISSDVSKAVKGADVVVDFTNAEGARKVIAAASENGVNCVIGSTGLLSADFETAKRVASESNISIIIAPNFARCFWYKNFKLHPYLLNNIMFFMKCPIILVFSFDLVKKMTIINLTR